MCLKTFLAPLILRVNLDIQPKIENVHYTAGLFMVILTSDVIEVSSQCQLSTSRQQFVLLSLEAYHGQVTGSRTP